MLSLQFVTPGDAYIRHHSEKARWLSWIIQSMCCLSGSFWTVAQKTSASSKTTLIKGLSLHSGLI